MNKVAYVCSRYRAETQERFEKQLSMTKEISRQIVLAEYDVIVPHLYYPQFLDDEDSTQRELGMEGAKRLLLKCDMVFIYIGEGISAGMRAELKLAIKHKIKIKYFNDLKELISHLKD